MSKLSSTTPYNLSVDTPPASSTAATAPVTMNTVSSSNNNNNNHDNNHDNDGINHYFQPRIYTSRANAKNNPLDLLVGVVGYNVTYGMWDYVQPSEVMHPLYGEFPKFKFGDDHAKQYHQQFKLNSPAVVVLFESVDDIFWNEFYVSLSKAMKLQRKLQIIFSILQPPYFICLLYLYNFSIASFYIGIFLPSLVLVLLERQIDIVQKTAVKYKDPFAERGVNLEFVIHRYPDGCSKRGQYSYYIVFTDMMPNRSIMEII